MARLAGRKNQGAWFRTNKKIKALDALERDGLADVLAGNTDVVAYLQLFATLSNQAGYTTEYVAGDFLANYMGNDPGIPWIVWSGELPWDFYVEGETEGVYVPVNAEAARNGANTLRKVVTQWFKGRALLLDAENVKRSDAGNPGGVANATKESGSG